MEMIKINILESMNKKIIMLICLIIFMTTSYGEDRVEELYDNSKLNGSSCSNKFECVWPDFLNNYVSQNNDDALKKECFEKQFFYRLVGEYDMSIASTLYIYASEEKGYPLITFTYMKSYNDNTLRHSFRVTNEEWEKLKEIFVPKMYKKFFKKDPMGYATHVGQYKMEICNNGQPFSYKVFRISWSDKDDIRNKSLTLIRLFRKKIYKLYKKYKRKKKILISDITEEAKVRLEQGKKERQKKYERERLWNAASTGAVAGIEYYKDMNANIKNKQGLTPLMMAVKNGYINVVRTMSEATVDVHQKDNFGKTVFDYIEVNKQILNTKRMHGALRVVEVSQIVKKKAKITQYDYRHDTDILNITINGAQCDAFVFPQHTQCRAEKEASKNEIFKAIKAKDNALFDKLLPTAKDLSIRNKSKYTPLWASIHYHNYYALERLLDAGADMYALDQFDLKTPVFWATMINDAKLLKVLLKHGADVNSKNVFGDVALSNAMYKCTSFETIRILLEHGANPYQKDKRGQSIFEKKPVACKDKANIEKMKKLLREKSKFSE